MFQVGRSWPFHSLLKSVDCPLIHNHMYCTNHRYFLLILHFVCNVQFSYAYMTLSYSGVMWFFAVISPSSAPGLFPLKSLTWTTSPLLLLHKWQKFIIPSLSSSSTTTRSKSLFHSTSLSIFFGISSQSYSFVLLPNLLFHQYLSCNFPFFWALYNNYSCRIREGTWRDRRQMKCFCSVIL